MLRSEHKLNPFLIALLVGAFTLIQCGISVAQSDARRVVLGAHKFAPNGWGFGAVRPKEIFNGGAPSGAVRNLRWTNWGKQVTKARGLGAGYKPSGGYYAKPIKVRLRADRIRRCRPRGPLAYTRLLVKIEEKPGSGDFTDWFRWAGAKTICSY